jgi:Cu2+-exporting ATPase
MKNRGHEDVHAHTESSHSEQKEGHGNHSGHDHSHHDNHDHGAMIADFRRRFWVSLVLMIPVVLLSPLIQGWLGVADSWSFPGDSYLQFVLATVIYFHGGYPFLRGLINELSNRQPGMMTLIGLAITVAYGYSSAVVFGLPGKVFFWELATLVVLMLLGHWIEMRSVSSAQNALKEIAALLPNEAHRLDADGNSETVPVEELEVDDRVLVKPGEKIPLDGEVVDGQSQVSESLVTGESKLVRKEPGSEVVGGAVNGDGALTVRVTSTPDEGFVSRVMEMVAEAQSGQSRAQRLADRAAFWLTIIAITTGLATLIAWLLVGREFAFSLERMVTVMVITCPHALGLAIPLVIAVSTSISAREGLLVRNRAAFEQAHRIDGVIFDKTGTLTSGKFRVSDVTVNTADAEDALLRAAATVETNSEHLIAQAIMREAEERGISPGEHKDFAAIPGYGAKVKSDGDELLAVSADYLDEHGIADENNAARDASNKGKTVVYILRNDEILGSLALEDEVRGESRAAIEQLKAMNISVSMLTGDSETVASAVADKLALDDYRANVKPDEKADAVREMRGAGQMVAMVGDGVNDAPALAAADFGIAIGAGTDVAVETADVILVENNPLDVVKLIRMSKLTSRKMVQNLWWAAGYNIVAIPLATGAFVWAGVMISPAVGAILMSLSTVIVAINARLLKVPEADAALSG